MIRLATTIKQMLLGLNEEVVSKAKELDPELKTETDELKVYEVGDYEVTISLKDKDNPMVKCTCAFWKYQGPEYHAKKGDYLLGKPQGTATEPKSKDPEGKNKVCKHVYATIQLLLNSRSK